MSGQTTTANCYTVNIPGTLAGYSLTIPGRLPNLNDYTRAERSHRQKGAKMKGDAQELVKWCILSQLRGKRIQKPVFLLFTWYEKDRRRDRDNVSSFGRKVIQDALVECGVLLDDDWEHVTGYLDNFAVDSKNPRIVVQFIEQEGELCNEQPKKSSVKSKR